MQDWQKTFSPLSDHLKIISGLEAFTRFSKATQNKTFHARCPHADMLNRQGVFCWLAWSPGHSPRPKPLHSYYYSSQMGQDSGCVPVLTQHNWQCVCVYRTLYSSCASHDNLPQCVMVSAGSVPPHLICYWTLKQTNAKEDGDGGLDSRLTNHIHTVKCEQTRVSVDRGTITVQ